MDILILLIIDLAVGGDDSQIECAGNAPVMRRYDAIVACSLISYRKQLQQRVWSTHGDLYIHQFLQGSNNPIYVERPVP